MKPFVQFKTKSLQGTLLRNCVELWSVVQEVMLVLEILILNSAEALFSGEQNSLCAYYGEHVYEIIWPVF